jgi:hypothetical protein
VDEIKLPQEPGYSRIGGLGGFLASSGARPARHARATSVVFAIAVGTLFLLSHPYRGIWHDAVLYTVQALHDAHPEHFKHDLFFQFGSQDDWTLYGKIYEKLIGLLGIRASNLLGLAVAQALWWSGMWRLSRRLLPAPWHWVCLLFVAGMPSDYGDGLIFTYDEFFLAARLPAEALCLWALAFALERRSIAALALAFVAMTIHPLMGAVGFATVLIVMTSRYGWWRIFAAAFAVFAVAQFLAPPSFAIQPLDSEWLSVLRMELPFLFPSRWSLLAWSKVCWVIALPAILAAVDEKERRSFWGSLALMGVAGVSVSVVADLAGHDAFWTQLQPWRVLWLLTVMQWVAVISLVRRVWKDRPALLWLLAICWLGLELAGGGIAALAIAAVMHGERLMKARSRPIFKELSTPYKAGLIVATVVTVVFGCLYQILTFKARAAVWPGTLIFNFPVLEAVIHTRLMVVLVCAVSIAVLFRERFTPPVHFIALICLILLCAYAIVNIDQRSTVEKVMETNLDAPARAPFAGRVAPGQMVYWDGPVEEIDYLWLLMRTASYYAAKQAAGMVFHRATTFEALRRYAVVTGTRYSAHGGPPKLFDWLAHFRPLSPEGILRVCREPDVDFVVSPLHYRDLSTNDEWAPDQKTKYWLYDCRTIDSKNAAPPAATISGRQ